MAAADKTYKCRIGTGEEKAYLTNRADVAARMHVEAVAKPRPAGVLRAKVYSVTVVSEDMGKISTIEVRDSTERKIVARRN